MATIWGSLGQVKPAATTLTAAYTVPSLKHAAIQIIITNTGASATVRVSHAIAGAADNLKQYIVYDLALAAGESYATGRVAVNASDVIRVYASTADVAFNVNGIEEDN